MRIALTQFVSLDGVSQGPGSADEDTSDGFTRGGWFTPFLDEAFVAQASEWLDLAGGLLFGRRTYEAFARDWPQIPEPDPFTVRMNTLPKFVVSRTLGQGTWNPTTVLADIGAVAELRTRPGRELQIHGSARLAASLLDAGIVDTLRLALAPTVVGAGRRLLTHPLEDRGFRLDRSSATPAGLVILEYSASGAAPHEDYSGVG
ncbi:dihydrofolate reductase [Brevibacterium sanguinis]|uniref:Dihydrofolate reductase n=2 Tax=Brevibacterium TaxID=1696 RepID=A0A366INB8_9MICO|nr:MULTISPECIES: dihydrofolate reductase family protein [Brevibacterium]RBP66949.1 dihydrofolate reductase [Brevibacterium sanguinis]RBP73474.1 dihydrofolate reductase [Brevibacterium celere]